MYFKGEISPLRNDKNDSSTVDAVPVYMKFVPEHIFRPYIVSFHALLNRGSSVGGQSANAKRQQLSILQKVLHLLATVNKNNF